MKTITRRTFVKESLLAMTATTALGAVKTPGANERVVIGVMGVGGRGSFLAERFARRPDVEVAYVCDADSRRLGPASRAVEAAQQRAPKAVQDYRRVLEDRRVDAVVVATPDHWHVLGAIHACQAGKDVYVEKPMSHNAWEGRKLVEAARRYQRVVQVGMQTRSAPYAAQARDYVRSGKLGDIVSARVFNMMLHSPSPATKQPVPQGLDYELWAGPAAKPDQFLGYRWLNLFEYSCGPIPGDAVHQLDLARMVLGDPTAPKAVLSSGGVRVLRDGRDTPDTQWATYEYDGFTLHLEAALWTPYMKKTPMEMRDKDVMPNWPFNGTRIEILGTKGFMYLGRHGDGWQAFDQGGTLLEGMTGRQGDTPHFDNFIQGIRTRAKTNADAEQGHASALLCHLANAACRLGGARLVFDPVKEVFPATPEANQFLKRPTYRQPWVVPERV